MMISTGNRRRWFLFLKIRTTVSKAVSNTETLDFGVSEFQDLIRPEYSYTYKILWFFIISVCFMICSYQIYESAKLLLSYPAAVDIHMQERTQNYLPPFMFYSAENDYVVKLVGEAGDPLECALPVKSLLRNVGVDYDKLWHSDDYSYSYNGHEFLNNYRIENISITTERGMFGQLTTFGSGMLLTGKEVNAVIKINIKHGKLCSPSFTLASFKDKINFRVVFWILSGYAINVGYGTRKYTFLNTPKKSCCSDQEFGNCYQQCLVQRIQAEAPCRLPFFQPTIKLPKCDNGSIAAQSLQTTVNIYVKPEVLGDQCGCTRTCSGESYIIQPNITPWFENESIVILKVDPVDVGFTERLAYDISHLLTDIGGNLGLCLGLSIPAILNIIMVIVIMIKRELFQNERSDLDVKIQRMVSREYKKKLKYKNIAIKETISLMKVLKYVATIACFSLAIFMIQERVRYYLTYSIRRVVDVEEEDYIAFPSYTICGTSEKVALYKRSYAKANNLPDWCEVDMFDMIRGKKKKELTDIWSKSEPKFVKNTNYLIELITGIKGLNPNYTSIATHEGQCSHFTSKNESFLGFFTILAVAYSNSSIFACRENYYTLYYDDIFSDTYDAITKIKAPISAHTFFDFRWTKLIRLKNKIHDCVDKDQFKLCRKNCVNEQLRKETNLCDLPFISFLPNLTTCSTPEMAKETREKYLKTLVLTSLGKTCHCIQPCTENVITITTSSAVQKPNGFVLGFFMTSNIVESVIEVEKYSLIALFSDIGNCLGLAVGFSVLTAAQHIGQLLSFVVSIVENKFSCGKCLKTQ